MLKSIFSAILMAASFGAAAQSVKIGAHAGALGWNNDTKIGYGANLTFNPYGFAAFRVDATFAKFRQGTYFSTSPAIILYPIDYEEMQIGILGGAGFYNLPGDQARFGLNYGVTGDFSLGKNASVGLEARMHPIFSATDAWTVFLTAGFRFETGSDW